MDESSLKEIAAQLRKPTGDEGIKAANSMNQGNLHINLNTIEVLNPSPGDNILEIGMGNGYFVREILSKDSSIRYTGCDFSEVMIREAERLNAEWIQKGQAKFVFGDVNQLPFQGRTFNKIFTINTIYFWDDAPKVFRELKRVLRPEGTLIISIRPRHQMENYPFTRYGFNMFTASELHDILLENGFYSIKMKELVEPDVDFKGTVMKMESVIAKATAS
jgi:ubiquinone/menaquinone biosynthesis C-methylase UbiE